MSSLTYNNIKLQLVRLREFSQEDVKTEDGTSVIYLKIRIVVDAVFNPKATSYAEIDPGQPAESEGRLPPETNEAVRAALLAPRKPLSYKIGSETVIESPQGGGSVDSNNGPHPLFANVNSIAGAKTWHVSFGVETYIPACYDRFDVATIRFEQRMSVDRNHYSTIVTTGRTTFHGDLLKNSNKIADMFRGYSIRRIPVYPGYRREGLDVGVAPDGNSLYWQIYDREQPRDIGDTTEAGSHVTDVDGVYSVRPMTTQEGVPSATMLETIDVRIAGNRNSTVWGLVLYGFALASSKMDFTNPKIIVRDFSVTQGVFHRSASVSITRQLPAGGGGQIVNADIDSLRVDSVFGDQQGANPSFPGDHQSRGTSAALIVAAAVRDACYLNASTVSEGGVGVNAANETDAPSAFSLGGPSLGSAAGSFSVPGDAGLGLVEFPNTSRPTYYSDSAKENVYSDYQINSYYEVDEGTHMARVGGRRDAPPQILNLWSRSSRRRVGWTAESLGPPNVTPKLPKPRLDDRDFVLGDSTVTMAGSEMMPDGVNVSQRVSGTYVYYQKITKGAGDEIVVDRPDTVGYPRGRIRYKGDSWSGGIIEGDRV